MPARKLEHQCTYTYRDSNGKHVVGARCGSSAIKFPKGSDKYAAFCASHIRLQKCPNRCDAAVVVGSLSAKAGEKRRGRGPVTRPCRNCALPGLTKCRFHSGSVVRVRRTLKKESATERRASTEERRAPSEERRVVAEAMPGHAGAPTEELRLVAFSPPPRGSSPIIRPSSPTVGRSLME